MTWPIENPQQFIVQTECEKAAKDNGFRIGLRERNGWTQFRSTTVPGNILLAAARKKGP